MADERGSEGTGTTGGRSTDRSGRLSELRAGISLVSSAGADLGWGAQPAVRVLPDGRLWLADLQLAVSATDVYQAARGLVAAQLRHLCAESGVEVPAVVGSWLVTLQTNEALLGADLGGRPGAEVRRDDAA
jgi:hypothetical protein